MIDKNVLEQYSDLKAEIVETREKINKTEETVASLEEQITRMESEGSVKDKVYGGEGGIQGYVIEGFPDKEYSDKKTRLLRTKMLLSQRKSTLQTLLFEIEAQRNDVEEFIASIDDSYTRRIVNLRIVDGLTWEEVATKIGGGNSCDSVRKQFTRYMEKRKLSEMSA